eukprot:scaffold151730_cov20-Tisochrysis_lutea.AAC.3
MHSFLLRRCVAQLAIARGDIKHARQLYESLVGAAAAGRAGPQVPEHWAAAEYGTLLLVEGERAVRHYCSPAAMCVVCVYVCACVYVRACPVTGPAGAPFELHVFDCGRLCQRMGNVLMVEGD